MKRLTVFLFNVAGRCGFLLLVSALLIAQPSVAQTEVSGTIVEGEWTAEGGPYLVVGDILIAGLEIHPGVEVLFTGDYNFEIAGVLTAIGTEQDSVRFASADTTVSWRGLFFNFSSPGSELAYVVVEGANQSGIRVDNSAPVLRDCRITDNESASDAEGGGMTTNSVLTVTDCVIERNVGTRFGGGVYSSGPLTLVRTTVRNNTINQSLSTAPVAGGGIYSASDLTLVNSVVEGNLARSVNGNAFQSATAWGGGIYSTTGTVVLRNSIVRANRARAGANTAAEVALGGGLYVVDGSVSLQNSIIAENTLGTRLVWGGSAAQGGGVRQGSGTLELDNSTVVYNDFDGLWSAASTTTMVANSILYFNVADEDRDTNPAQVVGTATVRYSDVQEGYEGEGNIDLNPVFASDSVFSIVSGSPAIDSGDPDSAFEDGCFPPGLGGARNDMGAHGGPGNCGWKEGGDVDVEDGPGEEMSGLGLVQAYPNPANSEVRVAFELPAAAEVRLRVFDVLGRELSTLTNQLPAGPHQLLWRAVGVASGVYLYRLEARMGRRTEVLTGRLTLLE